MRAGKGGRSVRQGPRGRDVLANPSSTRAAGGAGEVWRPEAPTAAPTSTGRIGEL